MKNKQVVVRFPPSPTGEVHIGNARTLLFNFLFAKKHSGKIIFRFEDTDRDRSKIELEKPMLDALLKLGLSWDEGPYRQSERSEIYKKYLLILLEKGLAYEDTENANKTGKIIRLKNPQRVITFSDLVKGDISIDTHTFKGEDGNPDIIIARSIDEALYHFTVVVDDFLMGVTHILRGDDHITSTTRQIMILEAMEAEIPKYAHFPNIIGEDRKKLSKRKGNTSLNSFFEMGYLPEVMTNYLALLGWNPGDEREFFTLSELIQEFSLERCQKSPAQFDFKKLNSINKHYIQKLSDDLFLEYVWKYFDEKVFLELQAQKNFLEKIFLRLCQNKISLGKEVFEDYTKGEFDYFFNDSFLIIDSMKHCVQI